MKHVHQPALLLLESDVWISVGISLWLMIITLPGWYEGGEVTGSDKPTASKPEHEGLSQNPLLRVFSIESIPHVHRKTAYISILGRKVEISTTGSITFANE